MAIWPWVSPRTPSGASAEKYSLAEAKLVEVEVPMYDNTAALLKLSH